MTKSEFISKVTSMKKPAMECLCDGDWDFVSSFWHVWDLADIRNKFCTPVVRMSTPEYHSGNHGAFYDRERKTEEKYNRWFKEAKK